MKTCTIFLLCVSALCTTIESKFEKSRSLSATIIESLPLSRDNIMKGALKIALCLYLDNHDVIRCGDYALTNHVLADYGVEAMWATLADGIDTVPRAWTRKFCIDVAYAYVFYHLYEYIGYVVPSMQKTILRRLILLYMVREWTAYLVIYGADMFFDVCIKGNNARHASQEGILLFSIFFHSKDIEKIKSSICHV